MKQIGIPIEEIEVIAATRFAFGAGVALLLGERLKRTDRVLLGWLLTLIGAVSTGPLIYDVYRRRKGAR